MRKILAGLALGLALGWCFDAHAVDNQTVAKCVVNPTTAADGEPMPLPCNVSGQLVTSSTGGGGGGGGGTVDQGTAAAAAGAWPVQLVIGGAVNAVGNPIFVKPGTGASFAVTGTFWQSTQPISAASLPLPSGAATSANQSSILTALGSPFQAGASIGNTAFQANAGTNLNTSALALETGGNLAQLVTDAGAPGATACATDTGSCNFNQQLQRLAQRLTTINTTLGSPLQAGGSIAGTVTANAGTNLNTSALALESGGNLATIANSLGGCAGQTVANTTATAINSAGSSSNIKLVSKASAKNVYVCSVNLVAGAAVNVALVDGTKTTNECDTSTAGMAGGATAATGWNLAANGGLTLGNGVGLVAKSTGTNLDVCLLFSAATQVSGTIVWAQF